MTQPATVRDPLSMYVAKAMTMRIVGQRLRETLRDRKVAGDKTFARAAKLEACTLLLLAMIPSEGIEREYLRAAGMFGDTNLSAGLKALKKAGLVEDGEKPADRRRIRIVLSDAGAKVLEALREGMALAPGAPAPDYAAAAAWENFFVSEMLAKKIMEG